MIPSLPNKQTATRDTLLKQIDQKQLLWDVLVIGGGATGLGVALDAVSRGYKTLLIEQSDFAKGTSSRSTKLVPGSILFGCYSTHKPSDS